MIDGDRVYVGINRSDSGDSHIFLDGTEASIKDYNEYTINIGLQWIHKT